MTRRNSSHPGWHLVGGLLVVGWVASMWALFSGFFPSGGRPLRGNLPVEMLGEEDAWFGLYYAERKIGWLHFRLQPEADGARLEQESRLVVKAAGISQTVDSLLKARLGRGGALAEFSFDLEPPLLGGRVQGRWQAGALLLEGDFAGESFRRRLPLAEAPLLDPLLYRRLAAEQLLPGQSYRAEVFDVKALGNRAAQIKIIGPDSVKTPRGLKAVFHVRQSASHAQTDTWLDEQGRVWREETSSEIKIMREDKNLATALDREGAAGSFLLDELIRSLGKGTP